MTLYKTKENVRGWEHAFMWLAKKRACIYLVITFIILAFGLRPKTFLFLQPIYWLQTKDCFRTFIKMKATTCNCKFILQLQLSSNLYPLSISRQINFPLLHQRRPRLRFTDSTGDHITPPHCSNLTINFLYLFILL